MADPTPRRQPRRPTVLVVDDNPAVCETVAACLRAEGFSAWAAVGGPEAVKLFRACGAIDLVLMEVYMPGWDGPRTLAALREMDPRLRCSFMVGHAGHYSAGALLALGGACFFGKPFRCAEVARALRQVLGGP